MEQQIRFCKTADGVRIAYAVTGQGPPIVRSLGWFTHLEHEEETPYWSHINAHLAREHTLVRYDGRGMGLSDRGVADFSLEGKVNDLEAVVDAAGLETFSLFAISEGGPTAVAYAARHPERIRRLVIYGSSPAFNRMMDSEQGRQLFETMLTLARVGWGKDHPSYRQFFTGMFMPDATGDAGRLFTEFQRASAPAETVVAMLEALVTYDVQELAAHVSVPTLVIHRRGDTAIPFEAGREFAALIPAARFLPLEGRNHVPMPDEPDTAEMLSAIDSFLRESTAPDTRGFPRESGLVTILFTDIEGSTKKTQAMGDAAAQEMLRTHNRVIREALKEHDGIEIKHTGDGIMASFGSARGALACAVAIQRNLTAERDPLRVKIGLNAGEPVAEEQDLFGSSVQLAARVCDKAQGGQILVSNVVRELAIGKGFLFSDVGDFALKGFEDPVRLYEVSWQHAP
jgi:class 3 adenylate cyclase